jgi:hypothetical protein
MAIDMLAVDCLRWSNDVSLDDWKRALGCAYLGDNGFEIARDLDRYANVRGIDAELVEILDSASSYVWDAHRKLVKEWVDASGVKPSLQIGQRIRSRYHNGAISGFVEQEASYLMIPDGEEDRFQNGGGVYVPYEEAEVIAAEGASA